MSVHYSYERLYSAARFGDADEIAEALFYLEAADIRTANLTLGQAAVDVAAENGHTDVVDMLIEETGDARCVRLFRAACQEGNYKTAKHMVEKYHVIPRYDEHVKIRDFEAWLGKGYFEILTLSFEKDDEASEAWLNKFIPGVLDFSFVNGNNDLQRLGARFVNHVNFFEWMQSLPPLHKAVFTKNRQLMDSEIDQNPNWLEQRHVILNRSISVLQLVCLLDDTDLMTYVFAKASKTGLNLNAITDSLCEMVYKMGKVNILDYLITNNVGYSSEWLKRVNVALKHRHVAVVHRILQSFRKEIEANSLGGWTWNELAYRCIEENNFRILNDIILWVRGTQKMAIDFAPGWPYTPEMLDFLCEIRATQQSLLFREFATSFNFLSGFVVKEKMLRKFLELDLRPLPMTTDADDFFHVYRKVGDFNHLFLSDIRTRTEEWYFKLRRRNDEFLYDRNFLDSQPLERSRDTFTYLEIPVSVNLSGLFRSFRYLSGMRIHLPELWTKHGYQAGPGQNAQYAHLVNDQLFLYGIELKGLRHSQLFDGQVPGLKMLCRRAIRRYVRYSPSTIILHNGETTLAGNVDKVLSLENYLPRLLVGYLLYREVQTDDRYKVLYLTGQDVVEESDSDELGPDD